MTNPGARPARIRITREKHGESRVCVCVPCVDSNDQLTSSYLILYTGVPGFTPIYQ